MIGWLRANHHDIVRYSRPIILGCGAALIGLASLPHTLVGRVATDVGIVAVAIVFLVWLGVVLAAILKPDLLRESRAPDQ